MTNYFVPNVMYAIMLIVMGYFVSVIGLGICVQAAQTFRRKINRMSWFADGDGCK